MSDAELYDFMTNLITNLPNATSTSSPSSSSSSSSTISIDLINQINSNNNCSDLIKERIKFNLLLNSNHKLFTSKIKLETILKEELLKIGITTIEEKQFPLPLVTIKQNFDNLLIPSNHYCRRASDVYYVTEEILLRTHLTAYLYDSLFNSNCNYYYITGPIYRRLEEDSIHSELSHQVNSTTFIPIFSLSLDLS